MGRITLLLIAAATAAVNPQVRERLAPHAERTLAPVYEWTARFRVAEISRALEAETARGAPLPSPDRLQPFLDERYPGSISSLDPWRTPYLLRRDRWAARVVSAGRDRVVGTRDDILSGPLSVPPR